MQKRIKGLTLIEMMLIIMLSIIGISIILSFLALKEDLIAPKEKQDILMLENALKLYRLDNGFYPTTEQGLDALIKKPKNKPIPPHWVSYLSVLPLDSWGQTYHYKNRNNQIYLFSCGPPANQQSWWYWITHYYSADKECL